jgi:hypothetical protein
MKHSAREEALLETLVIPGEALVALVDLAAYRPFVAPDFTLERMSQHLIAEADAGVLFAWGVGEVGNWRVQIAAGRLSDGGYRECSGRIRATTTPLHLTSYDELTVAAQFADVHLPRSGTEDWVVAVEPGWYDCRVVQLFDPALADTKEVFDQETPHFRLELTPANVEVPRPTGGGIPWLDLGR